MGKGEYLDVLKNCSFQEKTGGGQYQVAFTCKSGSKGSIYFDEFGSAHVSCSKSDGSSDAFPLSGCKTL
jgi:hypothetical protein